ncbi:MAG: sulfatase-like hydrolase/transferase [Myxococcota bacterium]
MNALKPIIAVVIVLNLALVAWLLLRTDPSTDVVDTKQITDELLSAETLSNSRYDIQDRASELNIILISLDALRFDHTGVGGHSGGLTRNLDQFAEEAVVFHGVTSVAPWTLPSHMSVWTGRWPSVHGVTNKLKLLSQDQMVESTLSPGIETYPDRLIRKGFIAAGFTGGAGVQGKYGFSRNFDRYLDDRYFGGFDYSIPAALDWLKQNRDSQFFLFLHGYDVHGQYALSEGALSALASESSSDLNGDIEENADLREASLAAIDKPGDPPDLTAQLSEADAAFLKSVYASKVRDADQRVGNFLNQLRSLGLFDRSIIVIMSDHGDEFMEHGAVDHGATLYQEQLHTVLMMRIPGYTKKNDITVPVRSLDIFPTLFDLLQIEPPSGVDGQSLVPLLRGENQTLPVFSETDYRLFTHLRMTRRGNHKLVLDLQDGGRELFNIANDPLERTNISSAEPRITYELEQSLRAWMDETRTNPEDYLGVKQQPISIF